MNEIRHAHENPAEATPQDKAKPDRQASEIRVLDDFELVLAGGGDSITSWP